jgi:hypothetical protein
MRLVAGLVQGLNLLALSVVAFAVERRLGAVQDGARWVGSVMGAGLMVSPLLLALHASWTASPASVRWGLRLNTVMFLLFVVVGLISAIGGDAATAVGAAIWAIVPLVNARHLSGIAGGSSSAAATKSGVTQLER